MNKIILFTCTVLSLLISCGDDKNDFSSESLKTNTTALFFTNHTTEGILTFYIESNDSWTIEIEDNDWLTLDKNSGKGNTEIKVIAHPNTSEKMNIVELTIKELNSNNVLKIRVNQTFENLNILDYIPDVTFKKYLIDEIFNGATIVTEEEAREVTTINISGTAEARNIVKSLEGIHFFTNLTKLNCSFNELTTLDVTNNNELIELNCSNNKLTSLSLPHNELWSSDIRCNTKMTHLDFSENQLKNTLTKEAVEITPFINLIYLNASHNKLEVLSFRNNHELTHLDCSYNNLSVLDMYKQGELIELNCSHNPNLLGMFNDEAPKLKKIDCSWCSISYLDLRKNLDLTYLDCTGNIFTDAKVLITRSIYDNAETTLNPSKPNAIYKIID